MTTAHTDEDLERLVRAFPVKPGRIGRNRLPPGRRAVTVRSATAAQNAVFPLTESQKEIWLAAQMGGDAAVAYNESLRLDFADSFDPALFTTAVHRAVARHPILLASIAEDGQFQRLNSETKFDIPIVPFEGKTPPNGNWN